MRVGLEVGRSGLEMGNGKAGRGDEVKEGQRSGERHAGTVRDGVNLVRRQGGVFGYL